MALSSWRKMLTRDVQITVEQGTTTIEETAGFTVTDAQTTILGVFVTDSLTSVVTVSVSETASQTQDQTITQTEVDTAFITGTETFDATVSSTISQSTDVTSTTTTSTTGTATQTNTVSVTSVATASATSTTTVTVTQPATVHTTLTSTVEEVSTQHVTRTVDVTKTETVSQTASTTVVAPTACVGDAVVNGGFEGTLAPWSFAATGSANGYYVAGHDSPGGLDFFTQDAGAETAMWGTQTLATVPGKRYAVRFDLRAAAGNDETAVFGCAAPGGAGCTVSVAAAFDWTTESPCSFVAGGTATDFTCTLSSFGSSSVTFDNVKAVTC